MPTSKNRIDWMPGPAALDALKEAEEKWPSLNRQALIDKLVLCGLSALLHEHCTPPAMHGNNRYRWQKPRTPSR